MISMLTLIRGTIDSSTVLRSVTTLQRAVGAQLLVVCSDLGSTFTPGEAEEARTLSRRAYDTVCRDRFDCRFKLVAG
jgi:hypothetical protein